MNREELLAALRELSDRGHGAAGFKPHYAIEQEILAEFDRLKAEVERLLQIKQEANRNIWRLQSQLDKISKPYHFPTLGFARDKAEYPWIRHEGKADGCPICRLKPLSEKLP